MLTQQDRARDVCRLLVRVAARFRKESERIMSVDGLTGPQYGILRQLAAHGPMPLGELGKRLWVSGANVTGLADKLEAAGLVRRSTPPHDRRVVIAELTPEGKEVIERVQPLRNDHIRRFVGNLGQDELDQLGGLLAKLLPSNSDDPDRPS